MAEKQEPLEFFKKLGSNLALSRKQAGLTQERLAELLGISQSVLTHYETAIRRIPLPLLIQIADTLGLTLEDLLPTVTKKRRGPTPKLEQELAKVRLLSENQQQMVIDHIQSVIRNNQAKA